MGHPARHEIEKHAKAEFAAAQERIAVKYAKKKRHVLAEAALRGNIGGYAPALTKLEAKYLRRHIIALAEAYVKAFDVFGTPCDVEAEKGLETGAQQIAGGSISAVGGELDLIETRIRRRLPNRKDLHGEIGRSMQAAINAGKLKLERQRIKAVAASKDMEVAQPKSAGRTTTPASNRREEPATGGALPESGKPRKRGRPQTIADKKKTAAALLKASGGTNAEAAAVIYGTQYPTVQQKKNVPAILRHYQQKSREPDSPVKARKTPLKPRKNKG